MFFSKSKKSKAKSNFLQPITVESNIDGFQKNCLTQLAEFIQSPENLSLIYDNGDKGGEINFSNGPLGHFDINKVDHYTLLNYTIEAFQSKLNKLQVVDFKICLSFVVGMVAIVLSPLSLGLSALISAAAFGYFGYQLKAREQAREQYQAAQKDMTNVYICVMNDAKAKITKADSKLPNEDDYQDGIAFANDVHQALDHRVAILLDVFNPLLSDLNIMHYTRNDIDFAITQGRNLKNDQAVENETTTKLQLSLSYLLYGQHEGDHFQVAKGLFELCKRTVVDMANTVYKAFADEDLPGLNALH